MTYDGSGSHGSSGIMTHNRVKRLKTRHGPIDQATGLDHDTPSIPSNTLRPTLPGQVEQEVKKGDELLTTALSLPSGHNGGMDDKAHPDDEVQHVAFERLLRDNGADAGTISSGIEGLTSLSDTILDVERYNADEPGTLGTPVSLTVTRSADDIMERQKLFGHNLLVIPTEVYAVTGTESMQLQLSSRVDKEQSKALTLEATGVDGSPPATV